MDAEPKLTEEFKARYRRAIKDIELALKLSTGHDSFQRRKIAYYAVCTYWIKEFDPFPGLVPYGPPSTGKSNTLLVLKASCCKVVAITGKTITPAALKACMSLAHEGCLIIEESDDITERDLEDVLITRYSRSSADNKKMVPDGHKGWELEDYATFGGTIAHRRNLFKDLALLRRVITVQTKRTNQADLIKVTSENYPSLFKHFHDLMKWHAHLPEVSNDWNVEPGIFDAYKPLVALATFIDDKPFLEELVKEMGAAGNRLRTEESYLEPQMLLAAVLNVVSKKLAGKEINPELVNIEINRIGPALRDEFDANCAVFKLTAPQRNRILREDLDFQIKSSGGRNRLWFTLPQLIKTCENYKLEDEILDAWKVKLGIAPSEKKEDQTESPKDNDPSAWDTEDE